MNSIFNNIRLSGKFLVVFILASVQTVFADFAFIHPGLLQNRADLERMKRAVAKKEEPIFSGFLVFSNNVQSQLDYKMRGPLATVGRNPTEGQTEYDSDANAAYQCAIMWTITGNPAYANKSKEIIDAWSSTLKSITGRDAVLMAGLGPFKMVNAAEILRYTDSGWSQPEIEQAENNFRNVIFPVLKDFAPFANGNWDTAAIKTIMAIGVFCDDRAMFERALRYYVDGAGDGRLTHYIINETGQCQESGRDQQHTQLGLAHMGDSCEIAWHQGIDLYGCDNDLLLKGFEYTAEYNLGDDVPFVETLDRTGKYHHRVISTIGRGRFRPVYEEIYNHYVTVAGLSASYLQQVIERTRPEGPASPGADHIGFGTLLFAQPVSHSPPQVQTSPASPGALIAHGSTNKMQLSWVGAVGAESYTVKRTSEGGDYQIIARSIKTAAYVDTNVQPGEVYRYCVSAVNQYGESPNSYPAAICAGLPNPWAHQDIGLVAVAGDANFDGDLFTLEGAGKSIGGTNDECQFAFLPVKGDTSICARFVPQTSSQFSKFGLMMRESSVAGAANVSFLLGPEPSGQIEAPGWNVFLATRNSTGTDTDLLGSSTNFSAPTITNGRLTGFCWLKLQRLGDKFTGSISLDGKTWIIVGVANVPLKRTLYVGLCACSGIATVTTTVNFDNVAIATAGGPDLSGTGQINSPDGAVAVRFNLEPGGTPAYTIDYFGKPIVLESRLGLLPDFTNGFKIKNISYRSHRGEWTPLYGERDKIHDNYHELDVDLVQASGRLMRLTFRAYNEGAAFCYSFPKQAVGEFQLTGERSEFCFPGNTFAYEEHGTEGEYHRVNVADIQPWCERPLTLEYASGLFSCLCEAENENYPRMLLSPSPDSTNTLVSALGGTTSNTTNMRDAMPNDPNALLLAGQSTPWRLFVVGQKPGDLLERDYLSLDLNRSSVLKDVSWIEPGKVMRDTTLTTSNSEAIIDFATTAGLKYIELDWHWYGSDQSYETGDATTVRARNLDLPAVISYAKKKNIGVILYVDHQQIKKQRDILFPLYEKWGVKGVKIGFIDVGPQTESEWAVETIKKAAEHHLVLDIHDGYRPTGLARTYPNLLTVEGVRGNEHFPTPEHNCTLPFTRYVAGAADYTICYYDHRVQTTHAHQLAMSVVTYSPLQFIFWYDSPSYYHGEPEVEFFRHLPVVWDDTKVINGQIGKFATVARRSGKDWFVGTINNSEPRQLEILLGFLSPGKQYIAHIYSDDDSVPTRTHVAVKTLMVNSLTTLEISLKSAGGQAMWITPARGGAAA